MSCTSPCRATNEADVLRPKCFDCLIIYSLLERRFARETRWLSCRHHASGS